MNLELHHFFILVEPKAEVAELLLSLGMTEREKNRKHEGQGTSNRCFDFSNGTLELLWVHDEEEALNGPGRELNFPERKRNLEASPFGIILNRKDNVILDVPFKGWKYNPTYFSHLNSPWFFHVGVNSRNLVEPLCFYIPFVDPEVATENIEQSTFKCISEVKIYTPSSLVSDTLKVVDKADRLSILNGDHLMEITFDEHSCGLTKDLRPDIPVIIHW